MSPLVVVVLLAALALALQAISNHAHQRQVSALVGAAASERYALARERHDLANRITSPEVVRAAPPAPPADAPPLEVLQALGVVPPIPQVDAEENDPDDFDEGFLVGTGPGEA